MDEVIMADKAYKTRCSGTMTESAYLAWIRSALRSKSLRWPPRNEALEAARRPYKGDNKRQKWEYACAICKEWYNAKQVVVDHYPKAAGSILSVEDIGPFAENLFCETSNLRVLCSPCHDVHTLAEKNSISFEQAVIEKQVIEICKQPVKKVLAFLKKYGYTGAQVSNAEKRKTLVSKVLKGE
jgi:hypothetical protein